MHVMNMHRIKFHKFYTNPNFLLDVWKDLAELNQKHLKVFQGIFGGAIREINIWPLRAQSKFTWRNRQIYVNMTPSKVVCTCHHIRRFLHKYLVLKNTPERTPDVRHHGRGEE